MKLRRGLGAVIALLLAVGCVDTRAQGVDPVPITPILERSAVHAGDSLRGALRVSLPDNLHIQSNAPRDKSLIPTVIRFMPSPGIAVPEVVFPATVEFSILGIAEPQAVFADETRIGVTFEIGQTVAPGSVTIPATFRYQACDDSACYPPKTLTTSWTFDVLPPSVPRPERQARAELAGIRYGQARRRPSGHAAAANRRSDVPADNDDAPGAVRPVRSPRHGRLHDAGRVPRRSSPTPRRASSRSGLLDGQGPLAILAIVFRRRAGAEPHAMCLADDPDQPGDHRRRRGRAARAAAACCSARSTARRWHWSTECWDWS